MQRRHRHRDEAGVGGEHALARAAGDEDERRLLRCMRYGLDTAGSAEVLRGHTQVVWGQGRCQEVPQKTGNESLHALHSLL